ncbi:MAG: hypothetical protein NT030_07625, partial [Candidatus Saganbacteria bacterium]|nr:hypothetical protein [Candidatus Saganbacteria bacterium]
MTEISSTGKVILRGILYIREYLDDDSLLKNRYTQPQSPLDQNGVATVKDEKWARALNTEIDKLTNEDKLTFIQIFKLTGGDGNQLKPEDLDGAVISDQILKNKLTTKDLIEAEKTINSSSVSAPGKIFFKRILYIREYLDDDSLLKNRYTQPQSPLDQNGVATVK